MTRPGIDSSISQGEEGQQESEAGLTRHLWRAPYVRKEMCEVYLLPPLRDGCPIHETGLASLVCQEDVPIREADWNQSSEMTNRRLTGAPSPFDS